MTDRISINTHTSIKVETPAGSFYFDPFKIEGAPHDAACILVTHDHYDHFSPEDIEKVAGDGTILVVPEKMRKKADEAAAFVSEIRTVNTACRTEVCGLELETVPAYNIMKPFHSKGAGWVGYILTVEGQRIYVAGDTDATKEAEAVKCDIALVPIGGTYTMDAKKAAALINTIRPSVAIPTHYGAIIGKPADADTFASLVAEPTKVVKKIQF